MNAIQYLKQPHIRDYLSDCVREMEAQRNGKRFAPEAQQENGATIDYLIGQHNELLTVAESADVDSIEYNNQKHQWVIRYYSDGAIFTFSGTFQRCLDLLKELQS